MKTVKELLAAARKALAEGKVEEAEALKNQAQTLKGIEALDEGEPGKVEGGLDSVKSDIVNAVLEAMGKAPALKDGGYVAPDSEGDRAETKTFGDFLLAVKNGNHKRLKEVYGATKALSEDSGTSGGYTVPTQQVDRLLEVAGEGAVVEPRAFNLPLASRSAHIPALDQTQTSAGRSNFLGGVVANWTEEAGALTETEPRFKQIELVAHKLGGYTLASNELNADSAIALEALLTRLFGLAVGWHRDYAFLREDGVGKPLGILNAPASIAVTRNAGSDFKLVDAATMLSKLPGASFGSAIWAMHQTVIPKLIQMVDAGNNNIFIANVQGKPMWNILGLPVVFTEKVPALGTAGDVMLLDLSYYIVANRRGLEIASSEHYKFNTDQITWRFTDRVDGQPWLQNKITLADGSTQISPFVYLN